MTDNMYRRHILDHYANPRHWGRLEQPDVVADADDPSCGDQIRFEVNIDSQGRVERVAFEGEGCMISMASASILAEHAEGKPVAELAGLTEEDMLALVRTPVVPRRRRCALLPLKVLQAGLRDYADRRG